MKKKMLRKLVEMSNKVLGEEKTNEIIDKTVEKVVSEIKPKAGGNPNKVTIKPVKKPIKSHIKGENK